MRPKPSTDQLTVRLATLMASPLWVESTATGQYAVEGSDHPWYVAVSPKPVCGCPDATMRWMRCKHQWAALLSAGDQAAVALAQQTVGRLPYLPPAPRRLQPPAASLADAVRDLGSGRKQKALSRHHVAELSSWLMTHPQANVRTWRAMAVVEELMADYVVQAMLCQIPRAMKDDTVRHALVAHAPNPATLMRLMPYCPPAEFQLYFHRLIELGHPLMALDALCDPDTPDRIVPLDLVTPHLHSPDGQVRERAIMALQRVATSAPADPAAVGPAVVDPAAVTLPAVPTKPRAPRATGGPRAPRRTP